MADPVFVVGASRSGTTVMSRVVGRSHTVRTLSEIHFFERLWQPGEAPAVLDREAAIDLAARLVHTQHRGLFYKEGSADQYRGDAAAIIDAVDAADGQRTPLRIYGAFLDHCATEIVDGVACQRACDQTPRNVYYIGEILEAFPEARIVNIVRDPRAVLLSQKNKWRRRSLGESALPRSEVVRAWSNYHPVVTARLWRSAIEAARRADDPRVLTVRFEDLLADPEQVVRAVAEHCGFAYVPELLDVPHESSSLASDEPDLLGLRQEVAEAWRHGGLSPSEVRLCEGVAADAMARLGYALDAPAPNRPALLGWYALLVPKLGLAALMNVRTMGNPITAARRRLAR